MTKILRAVCLLFSFAVCMLSANAAVTGPAITQSGSDVKFTWNGAFDCDNLNNYISLFNALQFGQWVLVIDGQPASFTSKTATRDGATSGIISIAFGGVDKAGTVESATYNGESSVACGADVLKLPQAIPQAPVPIPSLSHFALALLAALMVILTSMRRRVLGVNRWR